MTELEQKTYNFAIQAIGLAKSLEKESQEVSVKDLMKSAGAVSIKFIDAINAEENKDFALNLKASHANAKKSLDILNDLTNISNDMLIKQKDTLIRESTFIIEKLDTIIQKLIY